VAAAAIPVRNHLALILVLGAVYVCVIVLVAKRRGPSYGVPLAIAGGLAFDSFFIPPIREFGADNWQNWLVMVIYITMGVLVGMLASQAQRRAESSEEARADLAAEQAALRRVATLVAQESPPEEVFLAVAEEVGQMLGVADTIMFRYESDGTATNVADWGEGHDPLIAFGRSFRLDGDNVTSMVRRTGRPARVDDYAGAGGALASAVRNSGVRASVGCPIVVDGRLWGVMIAAARDAPMPADSESRIEKFTELIATSIANIQAREELAASRARILAATDEERRRMVRDLHDGAQQRLVHTVITLKQARGALARGDDGAGAFVTEALEQEETAMVELRELAHGILPSALSFGGLRAGVEALAARMPVPVEIEVSEARFPTAVEATAYFVVAEALTNVAKHAHAHRASVTADINDDGLRIEVADDGTGMADPMGHGLLGLADRLASSEGALQVLSAPGEGTKVIAKVPLTV
jgi:signal transduction histidine kinase